jgi:uncharacterized membrane protein YfcA
MQQIALEIVFGTAIGLLLGLVGGGGSILTVPILVYAIGLGVHEATATSLVIVGLTALSGALPHARAGRVELRTAVLFGAAGILGAFAGTWANQRVSGPMILLLFGLLMLGVAARMAFGRKPSHQPEDAAPHPAAVPIAGLVVGVMTGFFGVGGGFLIVPAMVFFGRLPLKTAIATSLVVISVNSFAGLAGQLRHTSFDWSITALFTGVAVGGMFLGRLFSGRITTTHLRRAFAWFVLAVGAFVIARSWATFS